MAFQIAPIPSVGAVASRPRKEPLVDEDLQSGTATLVQTITLFQNATTFANATTTSGLVKTYGRDTTISSGSGLPAAEHFYWYGWRLKLRSLGTNLNLSTGANAGVPEQINRLRELSSILFKYSTSDYITVPADELPSGTGPQFIATTVSNTTMLSLPSGVPDRRNFKDVTVSGRPPEIQSLEQFRVIITQTSGNFTPTVDLFWQCVLDGLRLKGITG